MADEASPANVLDEAPDETTHVAEHANEWHLLLLGLAGRVSDALLARCRRLLAEDHEADVGHELITFALAENVALFETEVDFLGDAMAWTDDVDEFLSGIGIAEADTLLGYEFAADPPRSQHVGGESETADRAAIQSTAGLPGTRGLWRAWRLPRNSVSRPATRVYVVEADEDADLVFTTAEIQRSLEAVGQADPSVEVWPTGHELPSYHRLARAYGELLWSRAPDPGVRIAVLFDEVDPMTGPPFREDHPTVDDEEWPKLVEYLQGGETLLVTAARLRDVVDATRGSSVPMSFRTDGTWVWSDATTYYLEEYRLLPDPEMVAHIRAVDHLLPVVDDVAMHRAMAALQAPAAEEPEWTFGA